MTNTEIIQAIRTEIERLKTVQLKRIQEGDLVDAEPYDKNEAYNELLSFLDTLESEKPMDLEGLKEELDKWRHEHFHGKRDDHFSGEYLERTSQLDLARHFAKWGAENLKK